MLRFSNHLSIPNLLHNVPIADFSACLTSLMIDFQQFTILLLVKSE